MEKLILGLNEVDKSDIALAGGKAANLGELIKSGFPVPRGFIVSTFAYAQFVRENRLGQLIGSSIKKSVIEDAGELAKISKRIQRGFLNANFPPETEAKILKAYNSLKSPVAVRSSATAEDLGNASFAGQQETFLNIHTEKSLIKSIKLCFASLFFGRAILYREHHGFSSKNVRIAVVIQEMVNAKKAGVMFTANPVNHKKGEIVVESVSGLGESLVSGRVTPNFYLIDKKKGSLIEERIALKEAKLSNEELTGIIGLGKRIEALFKYPQDIEFAIDKKIFILQARPITTL